MIRITSIFALVLALASVCHAQQSTAKWISKPVPHWSCPSGTDTKGNVVLFAIFKPDELTKLSETQAPDCVAITGPQIKYQKYDIEKYERIWWDFSRKIPKSGLLHIEWPKEFSQEPGCPVIKGDEKNHIQIVSESKDALVIHGKSGQELDFICYGLLSRTK